MNPEKLEPVFRIRHGRATGAVVYVLHNPTDEEVCGVQEGKRALLGSVNTRCGDAPETKMEIE